MNGPFIRTEILFGKEKMEKLSGSHVAVFGVGGVGSFCAEALVRSGVGHITLFDHDTIEESNLNRQIHAGYSTIGQYKADAMKQRLLDINPDCQVEVVKEFVLPPQVGPLFQPWDYILDAIDTVSTKLAIVEEALKRGVPIISAMGTGNKLYPHLLRIEDISRTHTCPLAKVMRQELKKRGITRLTVCFSPESPMKPIPLPVPPDSSRRSIPGSVSFVPPVAGFLMAAEAIRNLAGVAHEGGN